MVMLIGTVTILLPALRFAPFWDKTSEASAENDTMSQTWAFRSTPICLNSNQIFSLGVLDWMEESCKRWLEEVNAFAFFPSRPAATGRTVPRERPSHREREKHCTEEETGG